MKRNLTWSIALVAVLLGMVLVSKAEESKGGSSKTLKGEVLDMACYMDHGAKGDKHKDCADMCIKGGSPMGLLTTDGSVVLLVEDHGAKDAYDSLKGMAAEQVEVTGTEHVRGGITGIVVKSAKKAS